MKALIVDPDAARAATVADALAASGARAAVAPSASFALTMLEWNQQDVIISRAQVGDMDGPEFCSMIRADPSTAAVRFVLIASGVTPAQGSQMGVDLVIPEGLIGPAIVTRVMHLMRRDQDSTRTASPTTVPAEPSATVAPAAPPAEVAASVEPAPVLPASLEPVPTLPVSPEPAPTFAVSPETQPTLPASSEPEASRVVSESRPSIAAPAPPVVEPAPPEPVEITPLPLVVPPPAPAPPPSPLPMTAVPPAPSTNPVLKGAAPPPPPLTELESVGMNGAMRTFQGALGSLALEDLTKAIVKGSKTGRLLVVLGMGGGMIAFDGGRIVHAELGTSTGETAFQSLVAASHRDAGGKFCFIPSAPRDLANVPKTITRSVAELLSGAAQAINEGR